MLDIEEQPARAEESAKAILKEAADDPWSTDCIEEVLKSLVHSIRPDGEYYPRFQDEKASISRKPIVEYSPALILRKRSVKGLTDVLKRIKERIEREGEIPPEFGDLAEIPKNDAKGRGEDQDGSDIQMDGDIYFPKPSNEEQRKIVEKIKAASGVLVQGPPGTGKSHTIANLVCHLLAMGQRILITAKTPRALLVLERLLPKELRPLCINLLGSGLEEKRSLEISVNAVLHQSEQWNESREQTEIKKLEENLHRQREEKAGIEKRLRAIRESEAHIQTIADGSYHGTAAQIAAAVKRYEAKYAWFTDKVSFDQKYPLLDVDFIELLKGLHRLTPEKMQELDQSWPRSVQSVEQFRNLVNMEQQAEERKETTTANLDERFLERISSLPEKTIVSIREHLESILNKIQRLKSMPHKWICNAVEDVLSGKSLIWQELYKVSNGIAGSIGDVVGKADSIKVDLPQNRDQREVLEDALALKEHLMNGGKKGWGPFRPKAIKPVKYILKTIRVNGHLCNDLEHITDLVDVLRVKTEVERGWNFWSGRSERTEGPYSLQFRAFQAQSSALSETIALAGLVSQCRESLVRCDNLPEPVWHDESCLHSFVRTCVHALARQEAHKARTAIEQLESPVATLAASVDAHPATLHLLQAIRLRNVDEYARAHKEITTLDNEKKAACSISEILKRVEQFVPHLVKELLADKANYYWHERLQLLPEIWRWAQARSWIRDYINQEDAPSLERRHYQLEDDIGKTIAHVASLRAWSFCFRRMNEEHRRHMEAWQQSMRRYGKGFGKYAPRYRREAQKHLNECRDAVPAWVMPLHRVWDTVDPAPGMFDVIVVDEASQCGFEALPLLYLGKRILIVGDDKQISPDAVGIPRDAVNRLMEEFLYDFVYKDSFHVDSSLFDQGKLRYGTRRVTLREHFRCMPEIIRFSNDWFYSSTRLIPLRQYPPNRLVPLVHIPVQGGYREGSNSQVINRPEAKAIVSKVVEMCRDDRYKGKTMGVVVLQGHAQAGLIQEQLLDLLGAEEMEQRRLVCGNPYSFQGDERDIIVLSMVAAPNERIGPLTMAADERRFNVAASRARDQMWLFHSVNRNDLSTSCLRRRLLEFFEETKPCEIAGINIQELTRKAEQANRSIEKPPQPFDSWFEVDVALEIAGKGYQVVPQFSVAEKRIDLVIEGGHARLAVECDGDSFHPLEKYEQDDHRQRILERCGWVFCRIRASVFYADRKSALTGLWRMLEEREITPQRDQSSVFNESSGSNQHDSESNKINDEEIVRIEDTVLYVNEENPDNEKQALITREHSNPEWGTINFTTPIAQALLGARLGDVVEAKLPKGTVRLRIKKIIKKGAY